MIWLLALVFVGLIVWGIVRIVKRWSCGDDEGEWFAIVFGGVLLLIFVLIIGFWTMANGAGLAKWQAFHEANTKNYEIAVDETASYLSADLFKDVLIEGSIERFKLTESVSARIAEWRDAVNTYNTTIASMKYFNQNPFTGIMVPDGIEDMKLLVIK